MPILTTVTFHGLDVSDALRDEAIKHAQRLERFASDISHCEVAFHSDTNRRHRPSRFSVQLNVSVRGHRIGVAHGNKPGTEDANMYALLSSAFDAVTRRIEDFVRCRRGDVKTHTPLYPVL